MSRSRYRDFVSANEPYVMRNLSFDFSLRSANIAPNCPAARTPGAPRVTTVPAPYTRHRIPYATRATFPAFKSALTSLLQPDSSIHTPEPAHITTVNPLPHRHRPTPSPPT